MDRRILRYPSLSAHRANVLRLYRHRLPVRRLLLRRLGALPWVVAAEVAPNHVRTAALAVAIGVNWLISSTVSELTPIIMNKILCGTYLMFGVLYLLMSLWAYFCLPQTKGYALEDVRYLFEDRIMVRALQDAPGGKFFLGGQCAPRLRSSSSRRRRATAAPTARLTKMQRKIWEGVVRVIMSYNAA